MAKSHSTAGNGRLTPAVAYIRMSSDKQEASPAQQRAALAELAAEHGCRIVREYFDSAISGDATAKRKDFQRMAAEIGDTGAKAILCWDQDRFGRFDSIEAGHWIYPLRQAGVRLITKAQGVIDWGDFTSRVMYGIVQEGKHQYLHDLSRNIGRGILTTRRAGKWTGHPPYGYRIGPDGHLIPGPSAEVEAVRAMYQYRLKGWSYLDIARWLNDHRIKPPRAAEWSRALVTFLLSRRTYLGEVPIGNKPQAKYHKITDTPECVPDAHPAIIDQHTWDLVQATAGQRRPTGKMRRGALSGLLFCGRCGSPMHATRNVTKDRWQMYMCSRNKKGLGCGYCKVPQDGTLDMVATAIRKHVLRGSLAALEAAIERQLQQRRSPAAEVARIKREIQDIDQKLDRAAQRILDTDGPLVARIQQQAHDLAERRAELQSQLSAVSEPRRGSAREIAKQVWSLDKILRDADPATVRASLGHIVSRITLDFRPSGRNWRGKQYVFDGGRIEFHTPAQTSLA